MIGGFLLEQLSVLRQSAALCDLELLSAEGTAFPIHGLLFSCLNRKHFEIAHRRDAASQLLGQGKKKMVLSKLSTGEVNSLVDFLYGKQSFSRDRYTQLEKSLESLNMGYLLGKADIVLESDELDIKCENSDESVISSEDNSDHSLTVHGRREHPVCEHSQNKPCCQVICHSREPSCEPEIKTEVTDTNYESSSDETILYNNSDVPLLANCNSEKNHAKVKEEFPNRDPIFDYTQVTQSLNDSDTFVYDPDISAQSEPTLDINCHKDNSTSLRKDNSNATVPVCSTPNGADCVETSKVSDVVNVSLGPETCVDPTTEERATTPSNTDCVDTANISDVEEVSLETESCSEATLDALGDITSPEHEQSERINEVSDVSTIEPDNIGNVSSASNDMEHELIKNSNEVVDFEDLKKIEQSITDKVNAVVGATDAISKMIASFTQFSGATTWSQCIQKAKINLKDVSCMTEGMRQSILISETENNQPLDTDNLSFESNKAQSAFEIHRHLEPSCIPNTNCVQADSIYQDNELETNSNITPSIIKPVHSRKIGTDKPTKYLLPKSYNKPATTLAPFISCTTMSTCSSMSVPLSSVIPSPTALIKNTSNNVSVEQVPVVNSCATLIANTQSENTLTSDSVSTINTPVNDKHKRTEKLTQKQRKLLPKHVNIGVTSKYGEGTRSRHIYPGIVKPPPKLTNNSLQKVIRGWHLQRQLLTHKHDLNTQKSIDTDTDKAKDDYTKRVPAIIQVEGFKFPRDKLVYRSSAFEPLKLQSFTAACTTKGSSQSICTSIPLSTPRKEGDQKKVPSAYEIHRHLKPSCTHPTVSKLSTACNSTISPSNTPGCTDNFQHSGKNMTDRNELNPSNYDSAMGTQMTDKETQEVSSRVESKKVLSAYEIHKHLEPSCTQPLSCEEKECSPTINRYSTVCSPIVNQRVDTHQYSVSRVPAAIRAKKESHPFLQKILSEHASTTNRIDFSTNNQTTTPAIHYKTSKDNQGHCADPIASDNSLCSPYKQLEKEQLQTRRIQDNKTDVKIRQKDDITTNNQQESPVTVEVGKRKSYSLGTHISLDDRMRNKNKSFQKPVQTHSSAVKIRKKKQACVSHTGANIRQAQHDKMMKMQQESSMLDKDWKSYYQYAYTGRPILPKVSANSTNTSWFLVPSSTTGTNQALLVPNNSTSSPEASQNSPKTPSHSKRKRHVSTGSIDMKNAESCKKKKNADPFVKMFNVTQKQDNAEETHVDMITDKQNQDTVEDSNGASVLSVSDNLVMDDLQQTCEQSSAYLSVNQGETLDLTDDEEALPLSKVSELLKSKMVSNEDTSNQSHEEQIQDPLVNYLCSDTKVPSKESTNLTVNKDTQSFGVQVPSVVHETAETPGLKNRSVALDSPEIARLLSAKVSLPRCDSVTSSDKKTNRVTKLEHPVSKVECKKVLNTHEPHRHLEPSCTQSTSCNIDERMKPVVQTCVTQKEALANIKLKNITEVETINDLSDSSKENDCGNHEVEDRTGVNEYKACIDPVINDSGKYATTQQSKLEFIPKTITEEVSSQITPKVVMRKRQTKCSKSSLVSPNYVRGKQSSNECTATNQSENVVLYKIDENSSIHAKSMF